mgnify:CR=1 FL=1
MRVIIFFTYGISLKSWKESGLLDREIKLYKFLAKNYDIHFTFVTYGDKEDNAIIQNEKNFKIVPIYQYFQKSNNFFIEFLKSLFYPIRLNKIIGFENSIIKTNQLWGSWIAIVVKLIYGCPLIIRTGYDLLTFKRNENKSNIKIFFYKQLTKYSLKYSNYYIVTSSYDRETLERLFKKFRHKLIIIPNWVEIINSKNKNIVENKIISIGRLEKQKNFKHLIESFSNSNIEINIFGNGSEMAELVSFSKSKNTIVNFHGNLENDKLNEVLTNYRFFCTSTLYEGNPKAILEAMAAGCVVIAPNIKGINNIIQNNINGLVYDYSKSNPYEIYKKFVNLDTSKISQNAINYVRENHNLDRIAEKEFPVSSVHVLNEGFLCLQLVQHAGYLQFWHTQRRRDFGDTEASPAEGCALEHETLFRFQDGLQAPALLFHQFRWHHLFHRVFRQARVCSPLPNGMVIVQES